MFHKITPTAIALIVLGVWQLCLQAPTMALVNPDQWGMTDWLVNYEGGFVRRGLGGWFLLKTSHFTQFAATHLAVIFSVVGFFALLTWFCLKATEYFPLAFLLSCVLLGFPIYQYTIVRKDCILLLLLIACLTILRSRWNGWQQWLMVNICCCGGVLLHETFAFIALPALVFAQQEMTLRMMWQRVLYLSPAFACFVVVVLHHGDASTAQAIHDSWQTLWIQSNLSPEWLHKPFATIQSIGWTTEEGMLQTKGVLKNGLYQPAAWSCVVVVSFLLVSRFLRVSSRSKLVEWILLLVFQWICIMPLFLLGIDYGRWIFLWIASSIILFSLDCRLPTWVSKRKVVVVFTNRLAAVIAFVPRKEWVLLFFGLPILWGMMNFLNASPSGRLLWELYSYLQAPYSNRSYTP